MIEETKCSLSQTHSFTATATTQVLNYSHYPDPEDTTARMFHFSKKVIPQLLCPHV